MNVPQPKIDYINKLAFDLVGKISDFSDKKSLINQDSILEGSIKHKGFIDWTNKIVDAPFRTFTTFITGEKVDIKECYKDRCYGFDEESYKEFKRFLNVIHAIKDIKFYIGYDFLHDKSIEWIFKTYNEKQTQSDFWVYLKDEIDSAIKEYKVYFPILYLEIIAPFKVGVVNFEYFSKELLDDWSNKFIVDNPDYQENPIEVFIRKEFQGQVFASCTIKAEYSKARELAFEECSLSVDVLKMCSLTTVVPNYKLSFDIDSRTNENLKNQVILQEPKRPYELHFDMYRIPNEYKITKKELERILTNGLYGFHQFLLQKNEVECELSQLIINSIKLYAQAMSTDDLHKRVVDLFTIYESLLLKDENVGIIECVCRYASKLVFDKIDDRKYLIGLIKEMYQVRSAVVHHAKKKQFDIEKLKKLQIYVVILLDNLIKKLPLHQTKKSLLDEIDLEILKAY